MEKLEQNFANYKKSHQNPLNVMIHRIAVPLIMFSILGMLFKIPYPEEGIALYTFVGLALGYYATLSKRLALFMLFFILLQFIIIILLDIVLSQWFLITMIFIFVLSWVMQFIGHRIEGKRPSFFSDLHFLLIGPLWILQDFINR